MFPAGKHKKSNAPSGAFFFVKKGRVKKTLTKTVYGIKLRLTSGS